jgi:hypothetical protein
MDAVTYQEPSGNPDVDNQAERGHRALKKPQTGNDGKLVGWTRHNAEIPAVLLAEAWGRIKTLFAILAPIGATAGLIGAVGMLAGKHFGYSTVRLSLIAATCAVVLLVWVTKIAVPLVTRGRLPDGRVLTDVIVRRRLRRRRARNRRDARRRQRDL